MKNLTTFLLGGLVFISFAAATTNIMTVKPATPKQTIVKPFWGYYGIQEDMQKYMTDQIKKGFIVKAVTLDSEEKGYQRGIVVMEKY